MKQNTGLGKSLFVHDPKRLLMRFAKMKREGKPRFVGNFDLPAKHLDLYRARREIVVVIEPNLAERSHTRIGQATQQLGFKRLIVIFCVMRMAPNCNSNPWHARNGLPSTPSRKEPPDVKRTLKLPFIELVERGRPVFGHIDYRAEEPNVAHACARKRERRVA